MLDLQLPKQSGLEVFKMIRSEERRESLPGVVLTTSKSEETVGRSLEYRGLLKPVDLGQSSRVPAAREDFWPLVVRITSKRGDA